MPYAFLGCDLKLRTHVFFCPRLSTGIRWKP